VSAGKEETIVKKVLRREFVGSQFLFWIMAMIPFTLPFAILYFVEWTVTIEEEVEDFENFLKRRRLKYGRGQPG